MSFARHHSRRSGVSFGFFAFPRVRQGTLLFQAKTVRAAFSLFPFPPHAAHGLHEQLGFFGVQRAIIHVILR